LACRTGRRFDGSARPPRPSFPQEHRYHTVPLPGRLRRIVALPSGRTESHTPSRKGVSRGPATHTQRWPPRTPIGMAGHPRSSASPAGQIGSLTTGESAVDFGVASRAGRSGNHEGRGLRHAGDGDNGPWTAESSDTRSPRPARYAL
jgi:hypothetical protein